MNELDNVWQPESMLEVQLKDPDDFLKDNDYPVVKAKFVESFREEVRKQLLPAIKETFPSLIDSEKPSPPQNWTPNSISLAKKEDS